MSILARHIRFSINPFLDDSAEGANSYCAKPCGEGLCIYLGLWVELSGRINDQTGFVVNVVDIDRFVRTRAIPIFRSEITEKFRGGKSVGIPEIADIVKRCGTAIAGCFGGAEVVKMCLDLNPFRKLSIETENKEVFYFGERFEFAATHTLWNDKFSDNKNLKVFGKCAHPGGHGHNYIIEVTIESGVSSKWEGIGAFEGIVAGEFVGVVDHKNLNIDVPYFREYNPTVENIARFAWGRLNGRFAGARLRSVTVWENDRTHCTFCGDE
jgi:6-pyruvoyltetrahydropterin/6-carboxytetrahydropterin synthase